MSLTTGEAVQQHSSTFIRPKQTDFFSCVQAELGDPTAASFIVFDTDELRVAVNLRRAVFCHFLWEASMTIVSAVSEDNGEESPAQAVQVFFWKSSTPTSINAEAEQSTDIDDENSYLNNLFYCARWWLSAAA